MWKNERHEDIPQAKRKFWLFKLVLCWIWFFSSIIDIFICQDLKKNNHQTGLVGAPPFCARLSHYSSLIGPAHQWHQAMGVAAESRHWLSESVTPIGMLEGVRWKAMRLLLEGEWLKLLLKTLLSLLFCFFVTEKPSLLMAGQFVIQFAQEKRNLCLIKCSNPWKLICTR